VEDAVAHEVADVAAGFVRGVELHDRLGPQQLVVEGFVDGSADVVGADADERPDVLGVVVGEGVAEVEDVHGAVWPPSVNPYVTPVVVSTIS